MSEQELKACPMCRASLLKWTDTGCGEGYEHPDNGCYLSGAIVQPDRYAAWNRRASPWRTDFENAPRDGTWFLSCEQVVWHVCRFDPKLQSFVTADGHGQLKYWQPVTPPTEAATSEGGKS